MIDTKSFVYEDSRWGDIHVHLKEKGFDVYSPGMKVGECTSPYIVVKDEGGNRHPNFSTNVDVYSVMCYVPKDNYSKLEPFCREVKKAMKDLEPMILYNGAETPSYYDDGVKGHMKSIEYKNYKKL